MHEETYRLLKAQAEKWRDIYKEREKIRSNAPNMEVLTALAQVEQLLEEYERRAAAVELPARYARVHAMGKAEYVGPVFPLGRAYRIEHHVIGDVGDNKVGLVRRWHDVHAVHSVEYLTDAEWEHHSAALAKSVDEENEARRPA